MKAAGIAIVVVSALLGLYFVVIFARSNSPDRMLTIFPLFLMGLPLTFFGNIAGFVLMWLMPTRPWVYPLPIILSYLVQWQAVGWFLWARGRGWFN